ncbi:MAG: molybdopterin-dependent oxidoreductase [Candidatus Dormibacterales bacterium]
MGQTPDERVNGVGESVSAEAVTRGAGTGAVAGAAAGLAVLGVMYGVDALTGYRPLPEILQQPLLAVMPGPVFGFLIDTLQHLGKVLEEACLLATLALVFTGAGAVVESAPAAARLRRHRPLAAAAVLWLVLVLVVLPLAQDGFLGLSEGIGAPLIYALLLVLWAALVELCLRGAAPAAFDPERRRLLALVPAGIGLAGLVALGGRLLPELVGAVNPPERALAGQSPAITPVPDFYVVSKNFVDPAVAAAGWHLDVKGRVGRALRLDYSALRALPASRLTVTLECISNTVGGPQISTGVFQGVSLRDLVNGAGPAPGARTVAFTAADGYTEGLPLDYVMAHPEVLVAYDLDGSPLPDRHGHPARIVVPGRYGMKGPKWLTEVDLRTDGAGGYWEDQGWNDRALVRTMSRIDTPQDGATAPVGSIRVAGVAFAGLNGISSVEWSSDGGRTWAPATLEPPLSRYSWTLWSAAWRPAREGPYTLVVRARDGSGALQSAAGAPSFPSGSSGYHRVQVDLAARA